MRKRLAILPFLFCSLAFGQIGSNSITVSASNNTSLQPDQAVFGITVQSGVNTGLDDVLAALQGSGITIANFSGVTTLGQVVFSTLGSVPPTSPLTLAWTFSLPVPLTNTKATVASLTTLEQNIAKQNNGMALSFSIVGTQVSQQLAQAQTCSLAGLIATATTEAQSLASAANLTVGRILALSSSTSTGVSNTGAISGVFGGVSISTISATPPPCAVTVSFALTGY
ncbi:MAG: hypothetical protein WBE37_11640 [Bryobacteraceae bacterium]